MTEETPNDTDPEEDRGGAPEPADAKGGAGEVAQGEVEASAVEHDEVLGGFPDDPDMDVDLSAGDDADATRDGQSGGARGAEAGLGRHEPDMDVEEEDVTNE